MKQTPAILLWALVSAAAVSSTQTTFPPGAVIERSGYFTEHTALNEGEYTAQINGLRLWYKVSGSGPVCIFPTPGWGPSSELYFLKCKPLESMFTMVYLDTRGTGRSERPDPHTYTLQKMAADIEGLRKHLGIASMWLMGHSEGGRIILNYAAEHSDHVEGLILVDAPVGNTENDSSRIARMQLRKEEPWFDAAFKAFQSMPSTQQEFDTYIKTITPFFFSSTAKLAENREVFEKTNLSFAALQGQSQSDRSSVEPAAFRSLPVMPTLVIVGNDDFICPPSAAAYLHREIPNSELLVIEKAGHFPWLEQPGPFFDGIQTFFLKTGCSKK